jgi:drug/metabolite transporter (DMT)-like permease
MTAAPANANGRRLRADLALVLNTLIWGSTFVVVKQAIQGISPMLFLAFRFSIATLALALLLPGALRSSSGRSASVRAGVLAGLFLFCGYAFQTFGLRLTSPAKSAFITGLSIPAVPLLSALVYRIRPRLMEAAGVLAATAGLGLITLQGESLAISRGDLLTLACALSYGCHIVTVGHFSGKVGFEGLALTQVGTSALLSLALCWWFEPPFVIWSPWLVIATVFVGLAATALAFTIQAWAQQYTTSTRTALIFALEPVFAWITSYVVMGESLSGRAAAGAVLILGGILLVELKPPGPQEHPSG